MRRVLAIVGRNKWPAGYPIAVGIWTLWDHTRTASGRGNVPDDWQVPRRVCAVPKHLPARTICLPLGGPARGTSLALPATRMPLGWAAILYLATWLQAAGTGRNLWRKEAERGHAHHPEEHRRALRRATTHAALRQHASAAPRHCRLHPAPLRRIILKRGATE